ncbi:type III-A CRISPR-associated protein Cas10/Csm1 [Ligilactobacillus acidipiscis]|nr:type III-A CRISPR-associated protein Cas10/Csm1 [Ligilactobacillus acidipiscis]
MFDKVNSLFFSALLHDVDKVLQKLDESDVKALNKTKNGKEFVRYLKYKSIDDLKGDDIATDDLIYIILFSESIIDRVSLDEVGKGEQSVSNLDDIFNKFGKQESTRSFETQTLTSPRRNIFAQKRTTFDDFEFANVQKRLLNELKENSFDFSSKQRLLNVMEKLTSYINCGVKGQEDISFYDHARLLTCVSSAIYFYLEDNQINNYKQFFLKGSTDILAEKFFQLVSFDISGIQSFIYKITSKGAHKQLRSRSFYLDMISEWIVDRLLEQCGLDRTSLLYSGGGHAYLVLPNTDWCLHEMEKIEHSFNQFFLKSFSTDLYVAFGNAEFSPVSLLRSNVIQNIYRSVNQKVSFKKLNRYSADTILSLNKGGKKKGRECSICHTVDNLISDENKCHLCASLEEFSRNIQKETYFEVVEGVDGLRLDTDHVLKRISSKDSKNKGSNTVYAKNLFNGSDFSGVKIWAGDYTDLENNLFTKYAKRDWKDGESKGIKRIGTLRCDVDDLGYAFMAGFSELEGGKNNIFSRTATFSRSMSMFFKAYINTFAQETHLTIIYSGGDDVFVLGAWDEIIDFAVLLRQNLKNWSNGKLTLSAGIGLFEDKTPINVMARVTGDLEDTAKNSGKDSICLFDENEIFQFDEFIEEVYQGKLISIRKLFDGEGEKGNSFIYKLLDLIKQRNRTDRIAFARLAYYLSQLEEHTDNKQAFNRFKHNMMGWFDNDRGIKEAEMSLILYVYETRKEV